MVHRSGVPERTCVGCRRRGPKSEMLRVVARTDDHGHVVVVPDPSGSATGRGAHLHPTEGCLELATRAFARALRVPEGSARSRGLDTRVLAECVRRRATPTTE